MLFRSVPGDAGRFTDDAFHSTGIVAADVKRRLADGDASDVGGRMDAGRALRSDDAADAYRFKTPTLRDVARSAPYFHDGSVASLREAVEQMARGGVPNKFLDKTNLEDRKLTPEQISDVVEFLNALTEPRALREAKVP